ncbi:MAG: hypothetical protein K2J32_13595 [Ruminococcus sp.]|nr:hypothetical protein [Ruminococcus sp.]
MKNYEDIAERVFRKGDAILEKKHRRTSIIKKTSFVVSGLCAVIITGFGLLNNYSLKNAINNEYNIDSQNISENNISVMTQTSISTTTQTYLIVTDTINQSHNIYNERNLNMKKLTSFISALTISFSAMPTISNASGVPFSVNPQRYWHGEDKIFAKMESGELDVDINGNGEFDIMDCYLLDSYISEYYSYKENIDPSIIQRIESIADYNEDGVVDFDDTLSVMRYFIVSGNIRTEYLDPAYYDPDIEPLTTEDDLINFGKYKEIQAYVFPMRMFYHVNYLNAEYYLIDELYQSGTIDLDINGNGQLDVDDIYCMSVFFTEKIDSEVTKQILTEEEYQKCWDFSFHYSEHLVPHHYYGPDMQVQVASYILNHIEVKPEYFTIAYYKKNIDNYVPKYCTAEVMRTAALQIGIEVSDNIGPTYDIENDRNFFNMDIFNSFFESFCSDIENGIRPVPDVNLDGVVNYTDYFDMSIYWSDIMKGFGAERSILPEETWNTIDKYYGIPNDDSPTLYELTAAQLYIMEHTDEIEDMDSVYNAYVESLIKSNESNFEPFNYNKDVQILLDSDTKRSGDANDDGRVNMADAVLIMQSLSNPSEYKLTEKGKFNADVCDTGDGITAKDALQIQLWAINASELINA